MQLASLTPGAQVGVEPTQLGRRPVAPANLVQPVRGDIAGDIPGLQPILQRTGAAAERPAMRLALETVESEAIFHLDGERAAERIEPEHGIAGDQVEAIDRGFRDQIPIDGVAESLVDANP